MTGLTTRFTSALADRYTIERELGSGGMATVYLAHDVRHDRKVALKVLRPELAAVIGVDRFLAEIRTTANLQHPHILPLHDSGAVDGTVFYVMPFVQGESLRDRLTREKQLPIDDAVRITREVAGALDYAHRRHVIHRDVKPENILLHEGQALVADFGIALAAANTGGSRMTETGMSLGSPMYMSPEQAMGERTIDARTDIYALGCVLYEMLVGEPPFTGPTAQAIVAKVMTAEPVSPAAQRKTVPAAVSDAVIVALQKLPADRFASAAELSAAVSGEKVATRSSAAVQRGHADPAQRWKLVAAALGMATLGLAIALAARGNAGAVSRAAIVDVGLPDTAEMAFVSAMSEFSVSPNEDFVVYTAKRNDASAIWRRDVASATARSIPGTEGGVAPRVSPDARLVAFASLQGIRIVPTGGGPVRTLVDASDIVALEWVSATRLYVVDQDGNRLRWLDPEAGQLSASPITYCIGPHWLEEAQRLLCGGGGQKAAFLIEPSRPGTVHLTMRGAGGGRVAGTNFTLVDGRYLVYMSLDGDLRAASYDPASRTVGRVVTLVPGVRREAYTGAGQFRLTSSGTLVYAPGPNAEVGRLVKAARGRVPEPLPIDPAAFLRWDITRDGRRVAAAVQGTGSMELRLYDLRDGRQTVWLRARDVGQPVWNSDGDRIVVDVADSTGSAVVIGSPILGLSPDTVVALTATRRNLEPHDYPSERLVLATDWDHGHVVSFDPTVRPVRLDTVVKNARFPSLAPDGRHLAYKGNALDGVVVIGYPSLGRRAQISPGGSEPLWLSTSEVLFRDTPTWYLSRIDPASGEVVGRPQAWLRDPRFSDTPGLSQRRTGDGGIVYVQAPEQTTAPYLRFVPNWVERMKELVREADAR